MISAEMSEHTREIVCIDDNEWIGESIRRLIQREDGLAWGGWHSSCRHFLGNADRKPDIVVLDLDIPGEDAFETVGSVMDRVKDVRIIILSGYLGAELVDRALEAGVWGYISKNEAAGAVIDAIRRVAAGEVALSPAVVEEYQRQ